MHLCTKILFLDRYDTLGGDNSLRERLEGTITNLVEHPTQMQPPGLDSLYHIYFAIRRILSFHKEC